MSQESERSNGGNGLCSQELAYKKAISRRLGRRVVLPRLSAISRRDLWHDDSGWRPGRDEGGEERRRMEYRERGREMEEM